MLQESNKVINKYTLQLKNKELRQQYEALNFQVAMKDIRNIAIVMAVRSIVQIAVLIYNEDNYLKMFIYFSLYMVGGFVAYTFSRIFPRYIEIIHTIHIFMFISLILWSFADQELRAEVEGEKNISPFVRGFSLCVLVFIYNVSSYFIVKTFLLAYIFLLIIIAASPNPLSDSLKLIPLFISLIYREYCEDKRKKKSFLLQKKDDIWDHLTDKLLPTSLIVLKWDETNMRLNFYSQNRQARQAFDIKSTDDFNEFARKFIVSKLFNKPQVQKSPDQRKISWDNTLLNNVINKISLEKDIYNKTKDTRSSFNSKQKQFQFFPEFQNQEMKEDTCPEEQLGEIEQLVGEFRKENFEIHDKGDLFSVRIAAYCLNDWFGVVSIENESFRERFIRQNIQQVQFTQQIIKNYQYLYFCSRQNIKSSSQLYNQIQELEKSALINNQQQQVQDSCSVSPKVRDYLDNCMQNKQVQSNKEFCSAQTQTQQLLQSSYKQQSKLSTFESPRFLNTNDVDPAASDSSRLKNDEISQNPKLQDEGQQKETKQKSIDIYLKEINRKPDSLVNSTKNQLKWKYIAQENIKAIYNSMLLKVTVQNQLTLLQKQGFLKNYQNICQEKQAEENLLKIVNNISNTMANKLSEKDSQIKISFDPLLPTTVSTYHTKLSQLLFNCFNLFILNLPTNNTLSLSITSETVESCIKTKPTSHVHYPLASPSNMSPRYAPPQVSPRRIEQNNQIEKDKSILEDSSSRYPLVYSPIRPVDRLSRYLLNSKLQYYAQCEDHLSSKRNPEFNEKDVHLKFQFTAKMNDFVSLSLLKQPQDLKLSVFCRVEPAFSNPAILAIESIINEIGPYSSVNLFYDPKTENVNLSFFIYQKIPKIRIGKCSMFLKEYEGEGYKNYNEHMLNLAIKSKTRNKSTDDYQQDIQQQDNDKQPNTFINNNQIFQQKSIVNEIRQIGPFNKRGERKRKAKEKQMKYYSQMKFNTQEHNQNTDPKKSNYQSISMVPQAIVSSECCLTEDIEPQILKTNTKANNFKQTSPSQQSQEITLPQFQQSLVLFTSSSDIISQQDQSTIK